MRGPNLLIYPCDNKEVLHATIFWLSFRCYAANCYRQVHETENISNKILRCLRRILLLTVYSPTPILRFAHTPLRYYFFAASRRLMQPR
jgi:hypothetical protein